LLAEPPLEAAHAHKRRRGRAGGAADLEEPGGAADGFSQPPSRSGSAPSGTGAARDAAGAAGAAGAVADAELPAGFDMRSPGRPGAPPLLGAWIGSGAHQWEALASKMAQMFGRLSEQLHAVRQAIAETAARVAGCPTREEVAVMICEVADSMRDDDTAIGASPCKCLACGRSRVARANAPGFIDEHLVGMLNGDDRGPSHLPSSTVTLLLPDSGRKSPPSLPRRHNSRATSTVSSWATRSKR
jgi:hypothetical protein